MNSVLRGEILMKTIHGLTTLMLFIVLFAPPRTDAQQLLGPDADWQPQDYVDSQGISTCTFNPSLKRLECTAHLIGQDPYYSKSEVLRYLRYFPGLECNFPVDLSQSTITVTVFIPDLFVGEISKPNGVQGFVKDDQDRSQYGAWTNIT